LRLIVFVVFFNFRKTNGKGVTNILVDQLFL